MEELENISKEFWASRDNDNWDYTKTFRNRFIRQKQFLYYFFVPHIHANHSVLDLGCSNGLCSSFVISPYCKYVEGIDISPKFINEANEYAQAHNINAHFKTYDLAKAIDFKQNVYDHGMALGLFTCIIDNQIFKKMVALFVAAIKPGGYIALKDSVGENERVHQHDNYAANYRLKSTYINAFINNNCELILERQLGLELTEDHIGSYFFILQKK